MVTITLTPELERVITEKSQRAGTTPELIVLDALDQEFLPSTPSTLVDSTVEDFLGDSIGCLDSGEFVPGGARMSENIRTRFAEGMAAERRQTFLVRDESSGLPLIQCRRPATSAQRLTPERIADILLDQEASWQHEAGRR